MIIPRRLAIPCPSSRKSKSPASAFPGGSKARASPACASASRCAGRSASRREQLVGQTVGRVERRGKYLWLPLERGGLLLHLGMSGSLAFAERLPAHGPHDHFDLVTGQGTLRLTDPRRFGAVVWSPSTATGVAAKLLAKLGLEPFDPRFDGAHLHAALRRRKVAVKQALLGGEIVVGAGNIYACEALFEAGIDPRTRSDRISRPRADRLAAAVRATLARAVELGGSTLRDFRDAHGAAGEFQLAGARLRPRRRAVRALRRHGPAHRPGRAGDLLLPRLPAPLTGCAVAPASLPDGRACETSAPAW